MRISRAPLRISFFGGGTDYPSYFLQHGGAVLSTAIDQYIYNTINHFHSHLFDYSIRLSYQKVELAQNLREVEHKVYKACLEYVGLEKDLELHTSADLPALTGLGSSSTFTVSLLKGLHSFLGKGYEPLELAYQAIHIEQEVLKDSVGCQDQVIAAVGGFNIIEFRKQDDIIFHRLPISNSRIKELEQSLYLVFTKITRRANSIASQKISNLQNQHEVLLKMRKMVDEGYDILCKDRPLSQFGELLNETWLEKKKLATCISNPDIDALYELGISAGALGGKLLGAGGGGFMLFFVPEERRQGFENQLKNYFIIQPKVNASGAQMIFCSSAFSEEMPTVSRN